jgi:hypothetical protein
MKLKLAIRGYETEAEFDHFDDGSFEAFDVITAEVVEGAGAGQQLRILVESNSALAKQWNRPGETLTVSVEPPRLTAQVLFAGAFSIESHQDK